MTTAHWQVLLIYFAFTFVATLLAFARRVFRPASRGESVWRKYPTYILINLGFLAASWLSTSLHILTVLLAVLGGLAAWEIVRAMFQPALDPQAKRGATAALEHEPSRRFLLILLPCLTSSLIATADLLGISAWLRVWLAVFLSLTLLNTLVGRPADYAGRALALFGCLVYLPICVAAYIWLWKADPSGSRVVFLYLTVATNDAFAQITGQLVGSRPLAPAISPAKTVEGAFGGIVFAGLMGAALTSVAELTPLSGLLRGVLMGLAGLAGDLTASIWKRALGIKNFSSLLGGQGGILDRFDALIFAAPILFLLTL